MVSNNLFWFIITTFVFIRRQRCSSFVSPNGILGSTRAIDRGWPLGTHSHTHTHTYTTHAPTDEAHAGDSALVWQPGKRNTTDPIDGK